MTSIYSPEEDSYLMQEALRKHIKDKDIKVIEIGVGSGIQLKTLKEIGVKEIFGVDINLEAVKHCKGQGFDCKESNLFEKVSGKFNLIIFNSPYLPRDPREPEDSQIVTTGGGEGSKIINRFLEQARKHLAQEGKIFLLVSSLTRKINYAGYRKKIIARKKLFFEELILVSLHPLRDRDKPLHNKSTEYISHSQ